MDKAILTCALTGVLTDPKQHPVPVTAQEMAAAAREAYNAGASIMHVHLRQQAPGMGRFPSWDPAVASEIDTAIREAYDVPLACGSDQRALRVQHGTGHTYLVHPTPTAPATPLRLLAHDEATGWCRYELDGVQKRVRAVWVGEELHLVIEAATHVFTEVSAWPNQGSGQDPSRGLSPVAGTVAQVLVKPGDTVTEGQPLLSIEAMKMEMWLSAQAPGVVKAVHAVPGEQVQAKALLIDIELTKDQ